MAQSGTVRTLFPEPKPLSNQTGYLSDFGVVIKITTSGCESENLQTSPRVRAFYDINPREPSKIFKKLSNTVIWGKRWLHFDTKISNVAPPAAEKPRFCGAHFFAGLEILTIPLSAICAVL